MEEINLLCLLRKKLLRIREQEDYIGVALENNFIPVGMEQFHAAPTSQWNVITKMIDETRYVINILISMVPIGIVMSLFLGREVAFSHYNFGSSFYIEYLFRLDMVIRVVFMLAVV